MKIVVYSTTTCPYCAMVRDYLKSRQVEFEEIKLDVQPDQVPELVDTCGSMAVPCIHITKDAGAEIKIVGFDKAKLDQALAGA